MADIEQTADRYTLYFGAQYWDEVKRRIKLAEAGSRVLLASMPLNPDQEPIIEVIDYAADAASRGVETTMLVDAHSFLLDNATLGPLWWHSELPSELPAVFERKRALLEKVGNQPHGSYAILNKPDKPHSVPIAGRSHIKIAIIGDYVLIPNHNLEDPDAMNLAVGFENKMVADHLYDLMQSAARKGSVAEAMHYTDQTLQVDDMTTIYIDAGVPGQSLIYGHALKFIDTAQKWLMMTCQYFPNSLTARHLLLAQKRGVELELVYSHPRHHGLVGGTIEHGSNLIERVRLPWSMFKGRLNPNQPKMHAKLLASEQGLMMGSHNFIRAGVRLGTAEIAIFIRDEPLAKQAVEIIHQAAQDSSSSSGMSKLT